MKKGVLPKWHANAKLRLTMEIFRNTTLGFLVGNTLHGERELRYSEPNPSEVESSKVGGQSIQAFWLRHAGAKGRDLQGPEPARTKPILARHGFFFQKLKFNPTTARSVCIFMVHGLKWGCIQISRNRFGPLVQKLMKTDPAQFPQKISIILNILSIQLRFFSRLLHAFLSENLTL